MKQFHDPEAARLLARALAEDPLNKRERRIILKYLRYAVNGPSPVVPQPITAPPGVPRKGTAVAAADSGSR